MIEIKTVAEAICAAIQRMGSETATFEKEKCGLRGYPYYHDTIEGVRRFPISRWEEPFWDGLKHRLNRDYSISGRTEVYYPGTSTRCDLVLELDSNLFLWIEGKLLMEDYWVWDHKSDLPYYWENPKPKYGQWDAALADVGGKDMLKLNSLTKDVANYVGVLVLGFGRIGGAFSEESFFAQFPTELGSKWTAAHTHRDGIVWMDHCTQAAAANFRDHLWFWHREV